jgi:putative peptidoglycan lipid II flippase
VSDRPSSATPEVSGAVGSLEARQAETAPLLGGIYRAALLVAGLALAGRALGFLRDVLIARFFGASADTDAFYVAWTVPETASPLLVESAVIYALVPVFVRALESEGSAREALNRTLGPAVLVLAGLSALIALAAPLVVDVLAPGLAEHALATRSVRIASITVLAFGITGLFIAALRSREVFGVPASVTLVYNVGIIGCVLLLHGEQGVFSAAIGLAVGAAGMVLVQVPSVVRHIGWPRIGGGSAKWALRVFIPFVPIASFVLLRHSQVYVERFLGSLLDPGAISFLSYAERVAQVPLGLTFAIAIVSFPTIARSAARGRAEELRMSFERDLKLVTLVMIPAVAIALVFARPLIELLFERGSFTVEDTDATASVLQFYCAGIAGHALMAVAVLPVYGLGRRISMPITSAALGIAVTIAIAASLMPVLDVEALALASALGAIVMAVHLLARVNSSVLGFDTRGLRAHLVKTVSAAAAAGLIAWLIGQALPEDPIIRAAAGGSILLIAYVAFARALHVEHLQTLLFPVRRTLARMRPPRGADR